MRKNCRSLLLASLALTCGLLASCLSSGPEKPLGAMADAMEKNDSAAFLAQMDMPLFAANEARNMTNENEALNMLDSLGQDLGLGGMDQLLGSALNMEDKLRKSLTRGVSTGELMAHCRKAERPDCPWVPESLRNAKVVELGPDAAVASVTTPAGMTSWLALRKQGETWRVVVISVTEGDDKPLKYPYIFESTRLCVIHKVDLLPYLSCDIGTLRRNLLHVNPSLRIFEISSHTGEGLLSWRRFWEEQVAALPHAL